MIPRRIQADKFTPAERAIADAQYAVEAMPPDVRLTRAGTLLQEARDLVADFVDHGPRNSIGGCTRCGALDGQQCDRGIP